MRIFFAIIVTIIALSVIPAGFMSFFDTQSNYQSRKAMLPPELAKGFGFRHVTGLLIHIIISALLILAAVKLWRGW